MYQHGKRTPGMRRSGWLLAAGLLLLGGAAAVRGQETPPAPNGPPQAPAAPILVQDDSSGNYIEYTITVIGVGVALYTVCRSSRRN